MKLELKQFQATAVEEMQRKAMQASGMALAGDDVALVLQAPTGSGKTVMAAALMEALVAGTDEFPPDEDATFLWLTDQPELNQQTLAKFLVASSEFDASKLVVIEAATFDQPTLDSGKVYFLNTQKLAVSSNLVRRGDKRTHRIWDTLANTIAERGDSFWLVLDEAHRGTGRSPRATEEEPETIVQKFIFGDPGTGMPQTPLILAISATPDRFTALLARQSGRTKMSTVVEADAVRSSGLLKNTIMVFHPDEKQPSDESLLAEAARKLQAYEQEWAAYAHDHTAALVRPALVVQVEDRRANAKGLTRTDLASALRVLDESLGGLRPAEVGHAFQEGGTILVGDSYPLRYIAPSDIEGDPDLRVVFFKRSLTTGWDCPRAEVMMSYRSARDETLIAQLIGRMVRTPLAREVAGSALLGAVALYLPRYDRDAVESVIERLTKPKPSDGMPGTDAVHGNDTAILERDRAQDAVFDAIADLPAYKVERVAKLNPIRRLMRLGYRLNIDGVDATAKQRYERELLKELVAQRRRLAGEGPAWSKRIEDAGQIDVRRRDFDVLPTPDADGAVERASSAEEALKVRVVAENVQHAFADAGRQLGEGLHRAYVKARAKQLMDDGEDPDVSLLKREAWVLSTDPDVLSAVRSMANTLCDAELDAHETAINRLDDATRSEYRAILREGAKPKAERWTPPDSIEGAKEGQVWDRHLFVGPDGAYHDDGLTGLERKTLAEELAGDDLVAWLRNRPRKPWAFSVYYERPDGPKNMYPDFLMFRRDDEHILCDVLEPHTLSKSDSVAKAKGYARLAEDHGAKFGRIQMLDEIDGRIKRLNLKDPTTRQQVKALDNPDALRQLFKDA